MYIYTQLYYVFAYTVMHMYDVVNSDDDVSLGIGVIVVVGELMLIYSVKSFALPVVA